MHRTVPGATQRLIRTGLKTLVGAVFGASFLLAAPDLANARPKNSKQASKRAKARPRAIPSASLSGNAQTKAVPASPESFVSARAQKILSSLKSRPLVPVASSEIEAAPSKGSWLEAVYQKNLVETSQATEMLADKRLLAEVLDREIGSRAKNFYPKTIGLREFLVKRRLVNAMGELVSDGDAIEQALAEEFPAGFVVRPAVGIAPSETGRGLFPETDQFIVELLKPNNALYSPDHLAIPVKSHILDEIASGEAIVLQENVVGSADARKKLKTRYFQEVRVHTYEGRVVEGSVPSRWVQTNLLKNDEIKKAEAFVEEFLKSMSLAFLSRQAFGVDVAVMDNGEMRIIDVVTNRGKAIAWSGYLDQPRVIGAYSRHFEQHYGIAFKGFGGTLIRHNFANYLPYWEKRIDKAKPGWNKVMAWLPPSP